MTSSIGSEHPSSKRLWRGLALACLAGWFACLVLPAAGGCPVSHSTDTIPGWLMAAVGWLGPLQWQVGWYANPVFLLAAVWLLVTGRPSRAVAGLSVIALALSLTSFSLHEIITDGQIPQRLCSWQPGFWVWIGVIGALALFSIAGVVSGRRRRA